MLQSHVLDSETHQLPSGLEVNILTFEAVKVVTPPTSVRAFISCALSPETTTCWSAEEPIAQFLTLYDSFRPEFKYDDCQAESAERQRFVKRPFYAISHKDKVIGGIWIDHVTPFQHHEKKLATIHIFVDSQYRNTGMASSVLKKFESGIKRRYDEIRCVWDKRTDCNPAKFFEKHNYVVKKNIDGSGYALKKL